MSKFRSKNFVVGLDIGTRSVKMACFTARNGVLHFCKADFKEVVFAGDKAKQEQQFIFAINELLKGINKRKSRFIVSVNCQKTLVRNITIPYMPLKETRAALFLKAENHLSFPLGQTIQDFEVIGDFFEKGARKFQVLFAVSSNETINRHLSLVKSAGIKPAAFIPAPLALEKVMENYNFKEGESKAVLEIGENITELLIFSAQRGRVNLVFQKKIPVAGRDFTQALTSVLASDRGKTELSAAEAEEIKRQIGIPSEQRVSQIINEKISTAQILAMMRPSLEQLSGEIERCFDYYREETGGGRIDSLVLFGGGASLKGLKDFFAESLGIKTAAGNAFEGIKMDARQMSIEDDFSGKLELAVGAAVAGEKGINLLPIEERQELKRTFQRAFIQSAVISVILAAVFVYTGMKIQLGNLHKRIAVGEVEFNSLKPQMEEALKQNAAGRLLSQEPYWEDVFREISNIIPAGVYLTEAIMQEGNFIMKGIIISEESALTGFMQAPGKGLFKNVRLANIRDLPSGEGMEFEINCRMR